MIILNKDNIKKKTKGQFQFNFDTLVYVKQLKTQKEKTTLKWVIRKGIIKS